MNSVISVDPGNGGTKAVTVNGKLLYTYFPSVRKRHFSSGVSVRGVSTLRYTIVRWNDNEYIYGRDVAQVSPTGGDFYQGETRYGEDAHRFLVAAALMDLGIPNGDVELILYAPPNLLKDVKTKIERSMRNIPLQIHKRFSTTKQWQAYEWNPVKVMVLPESVAALGSIVLNNDGQKVASHLVKGRTLFIDIGAYTVDMVEFLDGQFIPNPHYTMTYRNQGLFAHVIDPIVHEMQQNHELETITAAHIEASIYNDFQVMFGARPVSIYDAYERQMENYAEWLTGHISRNVGDLRPYSRIFIIGGGVTSALWEHLDARFPGKLVPLNEYPIGDNLGAVFLNAIGGARIYKSTRR